MSSNLVIVAIPDQDDRVWRMSSEKIPHLTLLFLGDSGQVANLDQIMLFVEHAASTSLKRFYLNVDHRGELGANKADVLFFKKSRYDFAAVREFRSLLLKDTNIKTAYDSSRQFEAPKDTGQSGQPWIPHLTLGYPTAPAKPLPDGELPIFYDVSFNRIAVWTGDFEGPEFLLKDYWEDLDEMEIPMDVAMSDLHHHDVKGQKLDVEFLAHLSEEPWSNFAKADYTIEQWHAACLIHTHEGAPTAKSECKLPVKTPDGALNRNGVHAAAAALAGARGGLKGVSDDQKKKAVGALRRYYTQLDEDPPESLAQSAFDLGSEFILEHFGVKGMHWGVSKVKAGAKAVGRDLAALGAHLADSSWQNSTYSDIKHEAVHNHVAQKLDNRVERLQRSPKYRGKDLKADRDLRHEYRQDVAKVSNAAYRTAVKETYGENYTGSKTAHFVKDVRGARIEVRNKKSGETESEAPLSSMKDIKKRRKAEAEAFGLGHADISDAPDLVIELKEDANEQIIGVGFVKPSDETLAQSSADLGAEFILEHFGVKGMHWGQRKSPPTAVTTSSTSVVPHGTKRKTKIQVEGGQNHPAHDDAIRVAEAKVKLKKSGAAALSNQELRDMANRLQLENQVALLTSSKGKQFVSREFETTSKQLIKRGTKQGVKAYGPTVAKKAGKAAATAATIAVL